MPMRQLSRCNYQAGAKHKIGQGLLPRVPESMSLFILNLNFMTKDSIYPLAKQLIKPKPFTP